MNENLNLIEILKDCPKGTQLYSTVLGEVEFEEIGISPNYPIVVSRSGGFEKFTKDGMLYCSCDGECVLFPSREQRDWNKFKPEKPKFDPKTLQPFDKVLVRDDKNRPWQCTLFSYIKEKELSIFRYATINNFYKYCIPYNDDTKHLVGTTKEAPEYYRYRED